MTRILQAVFALVLGLTASASAQQFSTNVGDRQKAAEAAFAACKSCGVQSNAAGRAVGAKGIVSSPAYIGIKTNSGEFLSPGAPLTVKLEVLQQGDGSASYYVFGRKFKTDQFGNFQLAGYILTGISRMPLNSGDSFVLYNGSSAEDTIGTQYYFEAILTQGPNYDTVQVVSTDVVVSQYFTGGRDSYHADYVTVQNGTTTIHGSFPIGAVMYVNEGDFDSTGTFNYAVFSNDGATIVFPSFYQDGSLSFAMSFDVWIVAPSIGKTFTIPKAIYIKGSGIQNAPVPVAN